MYKRAAAACFILAGLASAGQATEISAIFTGITTEVWGDGEPGIFNLPKSGSPIGGSLTFDPGEFTPTPESPSGSTYLAAYTGGPQSVQMTITDSGGGATLDAVSALLLLCSDCSDSWSLLLSFDHLSFSLQLHSETPVVYPPGVSVFDLGYALNSGSTLTGLVSDSSRSLDFAVTEVSMTPEPSTFGFLLIAAGTGWPLWRWRHRALSARA
jgi:hypothetical protein